MKFTILCFLLIAFNICFGSTSIPKIDSTAVPQGKITKTAYYDGSSLWGYIDGGADLYLEYGFAELQVQTIELNGVKYSINIYQMTDNESAFGIFSVQKFKCSFSDSSKILKCVSPYQTQVLYGDLYISIVNNSGTLDAQKESEYLSLILLNKSEKKGTINIPELFTINEFRSYISELKYFKGILGLQNRAPEWIIDKFENLKDYSIYYLPVNEENENTDLAKIKFLSYNELKSFYHKFESSLGIDKKGNVYNKESNGKRIVIWNIGENEIVLLNSDAKQEKLDAYTSDIEKFYHFNN